MRSWSSLLIWWCNRMRDVRCLGERNRIIGRTNHQIAMEHAQCITMLTTPLTFRSNINEPQASLHLVLVDVSTNLALDEEQDAGQHSLGQISLEINQWW